MSSKFIPKSRIKEPVFNTDWSSFIKKDESMYFSFSSPEKDLKEEAEYREQENFLKTEKKRIEAIPLEELSFRDLYKFPFHQAKYGSWVYDANSNFIFQCEFSGESPRKNAISILNGERIPSKENTLRNNEGMIQVLKEDKWIDAFLIRGWGNLTGVGAYNLDGNYAAKIQDTLAEYIVEKLSNYAK